MNKNACHSFTQQHQNKNKTRCHQWSTRPGMNIVFALTLFCFARFWKARTCVRTTSAKTMITNGRDWGLAEWIKRNFHFHYWASFENMESFFAGPHHAMIPLYSVQNWTSLPSLVYRKKVTEEKECMMHSELKKPDRKTISDALFQCTFFKHQTFLAWVINSLN